MNDDLATGSFSKIAIIGPGLLGGSIALALRQRAPKTKIAIWARRESALDEAQKMQLADVASTDLEKVARDAELIVFCTPIGSMSALAEKITPHILQNASAIVTDVGSVKAPVVESLSRIFQSRAKFVGSHPMAGSEQSGLSAARADLFENAVCILTPDESSDEKSVEKLRAFWELLGCRVRMLAPREHDEIIAFVSHLPHLVAAAIVNAVCAENPDFLEFSGNGFRDTTRVASGPPAMWTEIFQQNREPLKKSVNAMIENLRDVVKLLDAFEAGDAESIRAVERFLTEAKTQRDRIKQKNLNFPKPQ